MKWDDYGLRFRVLWIMTPLPTLMYTCVYILYGALMHKNRPIRFFWKSFKICLFTLRESIQNWSKRSIKQQNPDYLPEMWFMVDINVRLWHKCVTYYVSITNLNAKKCFIVLVHLCMDYCSCIFMLAPTSYMEQRFSKSQKLRSTASFSGFAEQMSNHLCIDPYIDTLLC